MKELLFLQDTLDIAGAELVRRFGHGNNPRSKSDFSLVTDADFAAEKIILDRLARYFPDDAVISEEAGQLGVDRTPGMHVWVVDPLDGTTNFANEFPFFCISIARCRFSLTGTLEVIEGGIRDPLRDKTYIASQGQGAACNGIPIKVKIEREIERSLLVTGLHYPKGSHLDNEIMRFSRVAEVCSSIRRDGSAALDLALVSSGVYDAFWQKGLAIWDVAAGSLLVQEAGGIVKNYPKAKTSSLENSPSSLFYNIEGDGIVAGATSAANEIYKLIG
ncbi:MAG: inositol monophosphatase family protein [Proteobacteria bacterium]|nr:inositol monophosphatase family protein [Pseudomonadota bacterium]